MMNGKRNLYSEFVTEIANILRKGGIEDALAESHFITEYLTGVPYPVFLAGMGEFDMGSLSKKAEEICQRRVSGEPLQYIFGEWDFFGMTFKVGKGVLIPRPDTEILAEEAINLRKGFECTKYADICSGSGCVAAAVARHVKNVCGFAVEKSEDAFLYLKENLAVHAPEICPCLEDALLPETAAKHTDLDLITANPPYLTKKDMTELQREVTYEPSLALFGGDDGLMFYRELTRIWKNSLKAGGYILFEAGMGQHTDVMKILREQGFCDIRTAPDLAGIERVVIGRKEG